MLSTGFYAVAVPYASPPAPDSKLPVLSALNVKHAIVARLLPKGTTRTCHTLVLVTVHSSLIIQSQARAPPPRLV